MFVFLEYWKDVYGSDICNYFTKDKPDRTLMVRTSSLLLIIKGFDRKKWPSSYSFIIQK